MQSCFRLVLLVTVVALATSLASAAGSGTDEPNYVAGTLIELNDNGAWSWFMDERAIVHDGKLLVGSVRAVQDFRGGESDPNWGNVELAVHDIEAGTTGRVVLQEHYEQDDHNGPALLALPDGRVLAVYTKHATDRKVYFRHSSAGNLLDWSPAQVFESPGKDSAPFTGDNVTYSNLFQLPSGKIINFYRGPRYDPNYMVSDDNGESWTYGGRLLRGRDGYGPYLKYASDGNGTVHFVATEDHPRQFDNSLYHGYLREGTIYGSDGSPLGSLTAGDEAPMRVWDLTQVFAGDPDNVAWMTDLELDAAGHPCVVFSVQKDGRDIPPRSGGFDHRFHYARWSGTAWQQHEIAYAGTRLYPWEDDYTGLAAIDPQNVNVVYISTDADPQSGEPLVSSADGKRHRELFCGETADGGATWQWTPITANSSADNLRPVVPKWDDPRTALVWMRGEYMHNRGQWTTAVVAHIREWKQIERE
jgi:hypothetical protein